MYRFFFSTVSFDNSTFLWHTYSSDDIYNWSWAVRLVLVVLPSLLTDKRPQLVQVNRWFMVLVHCLVKISHAYFTKVAWMAVKNPKIKTSNLHRGYCTYFLPRPFPRLLCKKNFWKYLFYYYLNTLGLTTWVGLLRYAEITFSQYYVRRTSLVDGWCDEPWEPEASLILVGRGATELGRPSKWDYMEKSQPG